jgi:arylsulfatase A-like enzyme
MAKVPPPKVDFDGADMSAAFLGKPVARRKDLLWDYGRLPNMQRPGLEHDQSPNLAIRSGDWKLLINDDGSKLELYDFRQSDKEEHNVAAQHPAEAKRLSQKLLDWRKALPVLQE